MDTELHQNAKLDVQKTCFSKQTLLRGHSVRRGTIMLEVNSVHIFVTFQFLVLEIRSTFEYSVKRSLSPLQNLTRKIIARYPNSKTGYVGPNYNLRRVKSFSWRMQGFWEAPETEVLFVNWAVRFGWKWASSLIYNIAFGLSFNNCCIRTAKFTRIS